MLRGEADSNAIGCVGRGVSWSLAYCYFVVCICALPDQRKGMPPVTVADKAQRVKGRARHRRLASNRSIAAQLLSSVSHREAGNSYWREAAKARLSSTAASAATAIAAHRHARVLLLIDSKRAPQQDETRLQPRRWVRKYCHDSLDALQL